MAHMENKNLLDTLSDCARECEHCVYNVCLGDSEMDESGRGCIDCAQICWTTASYASRGSKSLGEVTRICAHICNACADECEKFLDDDMQRCAEQCRRCAEECRSYANVH